MICCMQHTIIGQLTPFGHKPLLITLTVFYDPKPQKLLWTGADPTMIYKNENNENTDNVTKQDARIILL